MVWSDGIRAQTGRKPKKLKNEHMTSHIDLVTARKICASDNFDRISFALSDNRRYTPAPQHPVTRNNVPSDGPLSKRARSLA